MNSIAIINPYFYRGTWVFDDLEHGLIREAFVAGSDRIITEMVSNIPDAVRGFSMIFSAEPFPGHQYRFDWRREQMKGNVYYSPDFDMNGWLCAALFHYFEKTPQHIYVQVKANSDTHKQPII